MFGQRNADQERSVDTSAHATTSARESTAAAMHRQPTPRSLAAAEAELGEISQQQLQAVEAHMTKARAADRASDQTACERALAEVQGVIDS